MNPDGTLNSRGRRRYYAGTSDRKKQAKGYQRALNDLDEERTKQIKTNWDSNDRAEKLDWVQNATQQVIHEATSRGYDVNSKSTKRIQNKGRALIGMALAGQLAGPVGALGVGLGTVTNTRGTKYSVKDPYKHTAQKQQKSQKPMVYRAYLDSDRAPTGDPDKDLEYELDRFIEMRNRQYNQRR